MRHLVLATAITLALGPAATLEARGPSHKAPAPAKALDAEGRRSWIVSFVEPPAPLFRGFTEKAGRPSLAPVSIAVTGETQYDPESPAAEAYLEYLGDLREQRLDAAAAVVGRTIEPTYVYEHALNGFAAFMTDAEADAVRALPGVRAVTPDFERFRMTDRGPAWIRADQVWSGAAGVTSRGAGVVVGVIDSGVNPTHPSFAAASSDGFTHTNPRSGFLGRCALNGNANEVVCNNKLIGIYDFVSGGSNGTDPNTPDPDGHGTHVAGTAVGNPYTGTYSGSPITISGVSPRSNLIVYRGCGSTPTSSSCGPNSGSTLVASINRAIADQVNVINYSIGAPASNPWDTIGGAINSDEEAFLAAREAGIVVATSAGNRGPDPGTVGSPSNSPWVMSVAAVTHDRSGAGDRLVSFSSRGPVVPQGVLKPDVAAPGVSVRAAGRTGNGIEELSGTSMASPHVAGAAALLKAARPSWNADQIISALIGTARPDNIVPLSGTATMTPHDRGAGTIDVSLAVNAPLFFPVATGAFRNGSPGTATSLNLPTLAHDNCVETCTLARSIQLMPGGASGTWQVIPNLPNTIAMNPVADVSLSGTTPQALNFTFSLTAQSQLNRWVYGSITLRRVGGGAPDVKLPVAIYLFGGAAPSLVNVNVSGERGFVDIPLTNVIGLTNARFRASDLAAPQVRQAGLIQDPTLSDPYDDLGTGVTTELITLDYSDNVSRTFEVTATLAPASTPAAQDLDLFVGRDTNFDQAPQETEELCGSLSPGATEACTFTVTHPGNGPAITLWALAQNFQSSTPGATDVARLEFVALSDGNSNVQRVTGPGATTTGQGYSARLVYDDPTFLNGQSRYAYVYADRAPNTNALRIPVKLTRTSATPAPFALQSGVDRAVTLPVGGAHDVMYIDVPQGATQLVATTTSSANVDLYLARVAPLGASSAVPTIAAAPARNTANASATTTSGNESVTVANPQPGRWYITPVNADGSVANATVRATITGSGAPSIRPGGYYNDPRSGHGLFLFQANPLRVGIWYTYLQDGTPTWYYLDGATPGANGLWNATIYRAAWNGSAANLTAVGTATYTPVATNEFIFSYNLDGQTGSERFTNFGGGCPTFSGSPLNVSSHWYNPARSGTGYSVQMFPTNQGGGGGYEFYAVFVYDGLGVPRFLDAQRTSFGSGTETLDLVQSNGFCPLCTYNGQPPRTKVGSFSRTISGGTFTNFTLNATFVNGVPGTWSGNETVQVLGTGGLQGCP